MSLSCRYRLTPTFRLVAFPRDRVVVPCMPCWSGRPERLDCRSIGRRASLVLSSTSQSPRTVWPKLHSWRNKNADCVEEVPRRDEGRYSPPNSDWQPCGSSRSRSRTTYTLQQPEQQPLCRVQGDPAQYILSKLEMSEVHKTFRGSNVRVVVIDFEIDTTHPDFVDAVGQRFSAVGASGVARPTAPAWPLIPRWNQPRLRSRGPAIALECRQLGRRVPALTALLDCGLSGPR